MTRHATKISHGRFETADGIEIRFTQRAAGHARAIVVLPGIFMHRDSEEHQLLAERLCAVADVFSVDVRGHGDSGGAFSFGAKEPADAAAFARWLRPRYPRIGALGFSFGGYHAAVAAAREKPFDAVATVGAPARLFIADHNFLTMGLLRSLPMTIARRRRRTRLSPLPLSRREAAYRLAARIAPVPLLVVHGADDWLIPPKHARLLFEHARPPKELALIPGGLHAENMLKDAPEPLLEALLRFFDARL